MRNNNSTQNTESRNGQTPLHTEDEEENLAEFLIMFEEAVASDSLPASVSSHARNRQQSLPGVSSLQSLRRKRELSTLSTPLVLRNSAVASSGVANEVSSDKNKHARYDGDSLVSSHRARQQATSPAGPSMSSSPVSTGDTSSPSLVNGGKKWTESAVEQVLASQTDPIGKFLRDLGVSAADAIHLNIMPHLDQAPRKPRTGYGKRKDLLPMDRKALSRERNREHARSTRQRRKVFETVLDQQLRKLGQTICACFTEEHTARYLARRNRRVENLVGFFLLMDSNITADTPVAWQCCLSHDLCTRLQLQGLLKLKPQSPLAPPSGWTYRAPPGGVEFSSPPPLSSTEMATRRSENGSVTRPNTSYCRGNVEDLGWGQAASPIASQGTGGGPMQRICLLSDLSPPSISFALPTAGAAATPTATAATFVGSGAATSSTCTRGASAFFGLPLSLLHLPPSPSCMRLLPLPFSRPFHGFASLEVVMQKALEALQQAVYHVLLTNSFYRKIFDLLVPDADAEAGSGRCGTLDVPAAWSKGLSGGDAERAAKNEGVAHAAVAGSHTTCGGVENFNMAYIAHAKDVNNSDHAAPTSFANSKQLFVASLTPQEREQSEMRAMSQQDERENSQSSSCPCDDHAAAVPGDSDHKSGLLCYPSSLASPAHAYDSGCSADNSGAPNGNKDSSPQTDKMSRPEQVGCAQSPELSNPVSDAAMQGSVASECPQLLYMQQHPPDFALEHLIPVGIKFLISCSKNDLLVQGTRAMCSFDVQVETKEVNQGASGGNYSHGEAAQIGEEKDDGGSEEESVCSSNASINNVNNSNADQGSNSEPTSSTTTTAAAAAAATTTTTIKTLINVPGALACVSFNPDVVEGSKIYDASFDLDVHAVALSFLDHSKLLRDYFGKALVETAEEAEKEEAVACQMPSPDHVHLNCCGDEADGDEDGGDEDTGDEAELGGDECHDGDDDGDDGDEDEDDCRDYEERDDCDRMICYAYENCDPDIDEGSHDGTISTVGNQDVQHCQDISTV